VQKLMPVNPKKKKKIMFPWVEQGAGDRKTAGTGDGADLAERKNHPKTQGARKKREGGGDSPYRIQNPKPGFSKLLGGTCHRHGRKKKKYR